MKLFLASETKNPETFPKLGEFVGGFKDKNIAYIPTAANGESKYGSWEGGGSYNTFLESGANINLVVLEELEESSILEILKKSDLVHMAGGACGYLLYWLRRRNLHKHLPELLTQGLIYSGSSAGSMITATDQSFIEWYIGEEEQGAGVIPGLDLVDFNIYPHYKDELYEEIKKRYEGKKLYLLKDGESIIIDGDDVKVLGEERIIEN